MAFDDYETAPEFQLLDSDALRNGGFANAHVMRAYARSTNRLISEGEPLLSLSWFDRPPQVSEDVELAVRAPLMRHWSRLIPGAWMRPKKPGLRKASVFIHANITNGAVADVALETLRAPYRVGAVEGDANVFRMVGTGAMKVYKFRDAIIDPGPRERFGFLVRGTPGSGGYTVADTNNYTSAGATAGYVHSIHAGTGFFHGITGFAQTFSWNVTGQTLAPGHAVVVHDGDRKNPYQPKPPPEPVVPPIGSPQADFGNVVYVGRFTSMISGNQAYLYPPPRSDEEAEGLTNNRNHVGAFFVAKLPVIRVAHVSIWADDL